MRWALLLLLASPAYAERYSCTLDDGRSVAFAINPSLFVNEFNSAEPIPRKRIDVTFGTNTAIGDPIRLGDFRGFSIEGLGDSVILFVVSPDGRAVLTNHKQGTRINGTCQGGD